MGFVKLDSGLLTSTLWAHREEREVFITALLMAEPHELREPTPQLEVDSLQETGFIVPEGWYGFVAAAGPGILRQALVKPGPGMEALRALGRPDPESRSKEFDGRRMVRVDGGYILLNYIKYRDRDYTAADRSRRYRQRKQDGGEPSRRDAVTLRRDVTGERRDITQAEAEYISTTSTPPTPLAGGPPAPSAAAEAPARREGKGKRLRTTDLKPASAEAFQAAWESIPKTVTRWDQSQRRDVEEAVAKGSRAQAERRFQAIVDEGLASPRTLYVAFWAYLTEGDGPKKGYVQHMASFFGPEKATWREWIERGRAIEAERYGDRP